jgi:D-ribose pyranose/furanose isomerase RbsD
LKGVDPSADNNYAIRMASANGHTSIVNILHLMTNQYHFEAIGELSEVKYTDIESDEECQVCYSEKINIKYNSCNHELCKDCMDRWRIINTTCPFCRTSII